MADSNVEHHAVLFALIAHAAQEHAGSRGEEAVLEGVRRYGRQRGARMADHARSEGQSEDMMGYLLYGELDFGTTRNRFKPVRKTPYLEVCAVECAWNHVWRERGMLDAGRLYCREIDRSIVSGYREDFRFELEGTLTGGDDCCRFHFYDGEIGLKDTVKYLWSKQRLGSRYVRPWRFHVAELYDVLSVTLKEKMGETDADTICQTVEKEFAETFGEKATESLHVGAEL